MRRLAMKALDADHIPWLYLFASFILLEAAAHADNHVKLGYHWLAYAAPVGIAAGALAAASAALQHHKLQMFTSAMVLAFGPFVISLYQKEFESGLKIKDSEGK